MTQAAHHPMSADLAFSLDVHRGWVVTTSDADGSVQGWFEETPGFGLFVLKTVTLAFLECESPRGLSLMLVQRLPVVIQTVHRGRVNCWVVEANGQRVLPTCNTLYKLRVASWNTPKLPPPPPPPTSR